MMHKDADNIYNTIYYYITYIYYYTPYIRILKFLNYWGNAYYNTHLRNTLAKVLNSKFLI